MTDKKYNPTKSGIVWYMIFSLIAVIFSIIALASNCPRESGIDYLGIIIGILAILVTLLVGWQIYNAITLRNEMDRVRHQLGRLKSILQNDKIQTNNKISEAEKSIAQLQKAFKQSLNIFPQNLEVIGNLHLCMAHTLQELGKPFNSYCELFEALNRFSAYSEGGHYAEIDAILHNIENLLTEFEKKNADFSIHAAELATLANLFSQIDRNLKKKASGLNYFIEKMSSIKDRHDKLIKS